MKVGLASSLAELDTGISHAMMTECEKYGMTWGCDLDCPVLRAGQCELKDAENRELYNEFLMEMRDDSRCTI